jgi:hypothetical protein
MKLFIFALLSTSITSRSSMCVQLWWQGPASSCPPFEAIAVESLPNVLGKFGDEGISNDDKLAIPDTLPRVG